MSEFNVTVVEYPKKSLAGLKLRTSLARAQADCPALWDNFGARMGQLGPEGCRGSYGVCVMLNAEDFDYWAAIEFDAAQARPEGLESLELPAGLYAKAEVPSLEKLGPAYMYLYEDWLKGQTVYAASHTAPCFEFYPPNWQIADAFEVFMPISRV